MLQCQALVYIKLFLFVTVPVLCIKVFNHTYRHLTLIDQTRTTMLITSPIQAQQNGVGNPIREYFYFNSEKYRTMQD